jgi:hypothetical protein
MRENRNGYRILVGKPEAKRPLGDTDVGRVRMGWYGLVDLAQDRDPVNAVMKFQVP